MLPNINFFAILLTVYFRRFFRSLNNFQKSLVRPPSYQWYLVPPVVLFGCFLCYLTRNRHEDWLGNVFNYATFIPDLYTICEGDENECETLNENQSMTVENRIKKARSWLNSNFDHENQALGISSRLSHISVTSSKSEAHEVHEEPQPSTSGTSPQSQRYVNQGRNKKFNESCKFTVKRPYLAKYSLSANSNNNSLIIHELPQIEAAKRTCLGSPPSRNNQTYISRKSKEKSVDSPSSPKVGKSQHQGATVEMSSSQQQSSGVNANKTPESSQVYHGRGDCLIRRTRSGRIYGWRDRVTRRKKTF